MHFIFSLIQNIFTHITGKKLFYITPNQHNALGKTAAWSDIGFWYVGNVYDSADIAYGIAQNGVVEKEDSDLVISILRKIEHPIVYDIGANTGYYGILSATKFGATVHSFDPIPEHIYCIKKSAQLNNISEQITTHTIALGNAKNTLQLSIAGSGSSLSKKFIDSSDKQKMSVPVETLDSLNLPAPHFIKIDVEGYEWEVLQGAKKIIEKHRPICFIEIAKTFPERNFTHPNWNDIMTFFIENNYTIQRNTPTGLVDSKEIPDGVHMYLFTPQNNHASHSHYINFPDH